MAPTATVEVLATGTGHEEVLLCSDPAAGYRGVIAVHSTAAGRAIGGTRLWRYGSDEEAIEDALRLSRGMTYKCAAAGLPLGGGKAVILANGALDREALFRAHGRFVERLGGRYVTAEDVGTSPADMDLVRLETAHVAGLAHLSGDPSPVTARGVVRAMQAAARHRWGTGDLAGRVVAIQGCGHVGAGVARRLDEAGARLVVTDVDPERVRSVLAATRATAVEPDEVYDVAADVFAPCALGGVLNERTIPRLRAGVVAGAANNQLAGPEDGGRLAARGILYTPDYVANAGGVINGCRELLGWAPERAARRVEEIYDTVLELFRLADAQGILPHVAADRLAERRLAALGS